MPENAPLQRAEKRAKTMRRFKMLLQMPL